MDANTHQEYIFVEDPQELDPKSQLLNGIFYKEGIS